MIADEQFNDGLPLLNSNSEAAVLLLANSLFLKHMAQLMTIRSHVE